VTRPPGIFFVLAFAGWGLFAPAVPTPGATEIGAQLPGDPMGVRIFRLDNGLTVYLSENHEEPRFYSEIAVRAGSKHDPGDATGMAHYLEHMLFKGTTRIGTSDAEAEKPLLDKITKLYEEHRRASASKRKEIYREIDRVSLEAARYAIPNEISKIYKVLGGKSLNAQTWHEETVYMVDLPANRLEHWAILETERFREPVFRLFHTELESVYEEKNASLDSKSRRIFYAVGRILYKKHPYGQQPTIGKVEHLKNPSLEKMYDYYRKNYVPGKMALLLSGDFQTEKALKVIEKYFSRWKETPVPELRTWKEPPIKTREFVSVNYPGEEYVLLAYRTVPVGHPDARALLLVDMLLDNSTAGLINLNLNQKQRVQSAGSYPRLNNDYGAQYLWGIPRQGQTLADVEVLLREQLGKLSEGDFDKEILPAIILDFKKTEKRGLENNRARVGKMRNAFIGYRAWRSVVEELDAMEKIGPGEIMRVAKKYFGRGYVAGYRLDKPQEIPRVEKPEISKIEFEPDRESSFARDVKELKAPRLEPEYLTEGKNYELHKLPGGYRLFYSENKLNDLFSFSMVVEKGSFHEKRIPLATALVEKSGTGEFGPEDLKKEWYKRGTDFSVSSSLANTVIRLSGLDEKFDSSLKLAGNLLRDPRAAATTLKKLIETVLKSREDSKKDHNTIHRALLEFHRYGDQSSYLLRPSNDQLAKYGVEELFNILRDVVSCRADFLYTGALPPETVIAAVRKYLPTTGKKTPSYPLRKPRKSRNLIYFFDKNVAQSQIRIEFSDGKLNEKNQPLEEIYNFYFSGGLSSIVYQELREARGLAYYAAARYIPGSRKNDFNLMVAAMECQADKTPEAVRAFLDLIENLPISESRFHDTKESILTSYRTTRINFRSVPDAVRGWLLRGLSGDPREKRYKKVISLKLKDLVKFHNSHLAGRKKLLSILGPRDKINMKKLEEFGTIKELKLESIFSY